MYISRLRVILTAAGKNQKNMLESKLGLTVMRPAWLSTKVDPSNVHSLK